MTRNIPIDKVSLKLIFVACGDQPKDFLVSPSQAASEIANQVFENWPQEWSAHKVDRADVLKFIYQGRFLHENVTLSSLNIQGGRSCVMHLIPREKIPEPNIESSKKEKTHQETSCCSCTIV